MISLLAESCSNNKSQNQVPGRGAILTTASATSGSALDGTGHSGGGFVAKSTPEQVNAVLDLALQLASASTKMANENIFVNFWNKKGRDSQFDFIKTPIHVFPRIGSVIDYTSPPIEALKRNKIVRLPSGDCPHPPSEDTADASVSKFDLDATICFSIGNLTRLPQSVLLQEILSLTLHEVSHMGGAEEPEARIWQSEFKAYFGARFGDLETDSISIKLLETIADTKGLIERANTWAASNSKDSRIVGDLSEIAQSLHDIPNVDDPLALTLKIKPSHPELIPDYEAAVNDLIANSKYHLVNEGAPLDRGHIEQKPAEKSEDLNLPQLIVYYSRGIDRILTAYLAFSGINSNPNFSCALNYLGSPDPSVVFSAAALDHACDVKPPSKN